jgi:ribosomal protein S18 acetylase RimI-like enzyme
MPIVYRSARPDDLEEADALVVRSLNDLSQRHGFGPMLARSPPRFQSFSLQDDPDGLWVAEQGGQMLGFALAWVCGDLWFLSQLFVAPGQQGRGIGHELIKRALDHAQKAGATNRVLITPAFNMVSQGLYMRHGLLPRLPLYLFSAARETVGGKLPGAQFGHVPLRADRQHLNHLAQIDAQSLGISREKHHKFLIDDRDTRGVLLFAEDKCVGYAYISRGGHVGPLAVARPQLMATAFRTALVIALEGQSSKLSAFLPGTSEAALGIAIECGLRIAFPMVLMCTGDFGDWRAYLPRNPGLM